MMAVPPRYNRRSDRVATVAVQVIHDRYNEEYDLPPLTVSVPIQTMYDPYHQEYLYLN